MKDSQSLQQHVNNANDQQHEENKQKNDKLREEFMVETSSL